MSKVWFITGSSRGFGREFALAALGHRDRLRHHCPRHRGTRHLGPNDR